MFGEFMESSDEISPDSIKDSQKNIEFSDELVS